MKRGQISLFIIIGILIIVAVGIFFVVRNQISLPEKVPLEVQPIDNAIEECVQQRLLDAVRLVGLQGGFIILPSNYLETEDFGIAYGYYEGTKTLISREKIQEEIDGFVSGAVIYCINEEDFLEFNVSLENAVSNTRIEENAIVSSVRLLVSTSKGSKSFTINREYDAQVEIRLRNIYTIAEEIVNKEIKDPSNIDLDYLSTFEYKVLMVPYSEEIIVYSITDDSQPNEIPYTFRFANKFKKVEK